MLITSARALVAYVRARDVLGKSKRTKRDRSIVGARAVVKEHWLHLCAGVWRASRDMKRGNGVENGS